MNDKSSPRWHQLESGQAMMEYWPTIPAAIAVMIAAGILVSFLNQAFMQTAEGLNRTGLPQEVCETTEEEEEGPQIAQVGPHTIELVSKHYDSETDTTTVVYKVSSLDDPSISHWVLGLPKDVADGVTYPKGQYDVGEWTNKDPKTGAVGIKFDKGYETGYRYVPQYATRMNDSVRFGAARPVASGLKQFSTGDSREIGLLLTGSYTYELVDVTIKAGQEVYTGQVLAPVAVETEADSGGDDPFNVDDLYSGCD